MSRSSKAYFESIGAGWDGMREEFFTARVRERALAEVSIEPGSRAADIGAGTGFVTEALLARGAHVVAVDQSPAMLEALRAKFPEPAAVDCRVGEAEALPVADGAVEHVFANMYLHHVETPLAAIREMARILRPGGRLVLTDMDAHDFTFLRDEHHDRWLGFEREDVERWFRDAGLVDVHVESVGQNCCSTSQDGRQASIGIFLAVGTRAGG